MKGAEYRVEMLSDLGRDGNVGTLWRKEIEMHGLFFLFLFLLLVRWTFSPIGKNF